MSHICTLLINQIRDSLEKLSHSGVGYIDLENSDGIYYTVDNVQYFISIKETKIIE